VLLVDDDPVNRDIGAALLRKLGHRPSVADDGRAALALAGQETFDAVLMDLHMPDMDGVAAVEQMRSLLGAATPHVVMLTADVSEQSRQRLARSGIDTVVGKPLLLDALRTALQPHANGNSVAAGSRAVPVEQDALIDGPLLAEQRSLLGAERLHSLRLLFEETSGALLGEMDSFAEANDGAAVGKAAHRLGGGASNLALALLSAECLEVERHAPSMSQAELQTVVAGLAVLCTTSLAAFDGQLTRADALSS